MSTSKPILPPKSNTDFQLLFGDQRNVELLADFLQSVLDIPKDELKARDYELARIHGAVTEERIAFAQKMLKRNRPIDEIAEDTGLTFDEIERLRYDIL